MSVTGYLITLLRCVFEAGRHSDAGSAIRYKLKPLSHVETLIKLKLVCNGAEK